MGRFGKLADRGAGSGAIPCAFRGEYGGVSRRSGTGGDALWAGRICCPAPPSADAGQPAGGTGLQAGGRPCGSCPASVAHSSEAPTRDLKLRRGGSQSATSAAATRSADSASATSAVGRSDSNPQTGSPSSASSLPPDRIDPSQRTVRGDLEILGAQVDQLHRIGKRRRLRLPDRGKAGAVAGDRPARGQDQPRLEPGQIAKDRNIGTPARRNEPQIVAGSLHCMARSAPPARPPGMAGRPRLIWPAPGWGRNARRDIAAAARPPRSPHRSRWRQPPARSSSAPRRAAAAARPAAVAPEASS